MRLRAALHELRCRECRVTWRSWWQRFVGDPRGMTPPRPAQGRKRSAPVDGRIVMTWKEGDAVATRPVWRWWPLDWYRLAVDPQWRAWRRRARTMTGTAGPRPSPEGHDAGGMTAWTSTT